MLRRSIGPLLLLLVPAACVAQAPAAVPAPAAFLAADVHPSAYSVFPYPRAVLRGDLWSMRQATLLDLIVTAYGAEAANVVGGPAWIQFDRFDVYAKTPPKTTSSEVPPLLRTLLRDRFHVVVHTDTRPLPAYLLTVGKGVPKLKEGDAGAAPDCDTKRPAPGATGAQGYTTLICRNESMDALRGLLQSYGAPYMGKPVVDATGLKGTWNFELQWTARPADGGRSIFDAVEKQLGLKLELGAAPAAVVQVDSASEVPTPNRADLAKVLPPPPVPEFEVATIRPPAPDEKRFADVQGTQVTLRATPLQFLLTFAYGVTDEFLVNAPKFIDTDFFDVIAKAGTSRAPGEQRMDPEDLQMMMRGLLAERFKLKVHTEDRPMEAYTLLAGTAPKLKPADPTDRTACKEGPGADGKDPRLTSPILSRLLTCRNVTMKQFAAMLQPQASAYIHTPVLDATGIEGAYDLTLSFSSQTQAMGAAGSGGDGAPADPNGALSLPDAISRQLGLKLVKQRRPVQVVVIDHLDEKPTEN
jgi:uncharacterized protein (TIGR03435 family)